MIFAENRGLALILLVVLPLLYLFTRVVQKRMLKAQLQNRAAVARASAHVPETLRCIRLIPSLDPERLLSALVMNGNGFLYQKTGYILEALNDGLHLPDSFFDECQRHISGSKKYLMREHWQDKLNEKWKLFAPAKLTDLLDKGVTYHDAV